MLYEGTILESVSYSQGVDDPHRYTLMIDSYSWKTRYKIDKFSEIFKFSPLHTNDRQL